jgi:hypothetical protein
MDRFQNHLIDNAQELIHKNNKNLNKNSLFFLKTRFLIKSKNFENNLWGQIKSKYWNSIISLARGSKI